MGLPREASDPTRYEQGVIRPSDRAAGAPWGEPNWANPTFGWEKLDYARDSAPIFFHKAYDVADKHLRDKVSVDEIKAVFKREGVKAEELEISGIEELLFEPHQAQFGKKGMAKKDLLQFLSSQGVRGHGCPLEAGRRHDRARASRSQRGDPTW